MAKEGRGRGRNDSGLNFLRQAYVGKDSSLDELCLSNNITAQPFLLNWESRRLQCPSRRRQRPSRRRPHRKRLWCFFSPFRQGVESYFANHPRTSAECRRQWRDQRLPRRPRTRADASAGTMTRSPSCSRTKERSSPLRSRFPKAKPRLSRGTCSDFFSKQVFSEFPVLN